MRAPPTWRRRQTLAGLTDARPHLAPRLDRLFAKLVTVGHPDHSAGEVVLGYRFDDRLHGNPGLPGAGDALLVVVQRRQLCGTLHFQPGIPLAGSLAGPFVWKAEGLDERDRSWRTGPLLRRIEVVQLPAVLPESVRMPSRDCGFGESLAAEFLTVGFEHGDQHPGELVAKRLLADGGQQPVRVGRLLVDRVAPVLDFPGCPPSRS